MKSYSQTVSIIKEIEISTGLEDVKISAEVSLKDQGIGPYEFWGSKGWHSDIRPVATDIRADWNLYSKSDSITIDKFISDHEYEITEQLCELYQHDN